MQLFESARLDRHTSSSFQIRRQQFLERHGWDLSANDCGEEIDEYDDGQSSYVAVVDEDTVVVTCRLRHANHGSMLEDHFLTAFGLSGANWQGLGNRMELTRFCRAPDISRKQCASALKLIGDHLRAAQQHEGHEGYVAVVYEPVARLLRMNGIPFEIMAAAEEIGGKKALLLDIDFSEQFVEMPLAA